MIRNALVIEYPLHYYHLVFSAPLDRSAATEGRELDLSGQVNGRLSLVCRRA